MSKHYYDPKDYEVQTMRKIRKIIIHAADTPPNMDIGVEEIRDWHVNGNGWRDIGYHYVIRRDGTVERGRSEEVAGAHVYGHNSDSIGICLVGGKPARHGGPACNFTRAQWIALEDRVRDLVRRYPMVEVSGHNDYTSDK